MEERDELERRSRHAFAPTTSKQTTGSQERRKNAIREWREFAIEEWREITVREWGRVDIKKEEQVA
jgi:hypothetical protein